MSYDASQVAFIDTETTGLDPETDNVWEIAVIVGRIEHVWQQSIPDLIDDDGRQDWTVVNPWVVENTGIQTRFDPESAVHPITSVERFATLVKGRHLVGACPWFDSERLHRVLLGWASWGGLFGRDLPWHYHLIDVENLAVGYLGGLFSDDPDEGTYACSRMRMSQVSVLPWKSEDLSLALGVDPSQFQPKHSALADARWAKAMFEAIMGGPE